MTSFGLAGRSTALTRRAEPKLAGESGDVGGEETDGLVGGRTTETERSGAVGDLPPPLAFRMISNCGADSEAEAAALGAEAEALELERLPAVDHVVTVDAAVDVVPAPARSCGRTTAVAVVACWLLALVQLVALVASETLSGVVEAVGADGAGALPPSASPFSCSLVMP